MPILLSWVADCRPAVLLASIIVLASGNAQTGRPINELPMYGGEHDPGVEQNPQYSKDAAELGWKYLYRGDLDTAIKRFNQAWMFDRKNPQAFWGFGVILGRRAETEEPEKNLRESMRLLKMAVELDPQNARIITDLAHSHSVLAAWLKSEKREDSQLGVTAETLFRKALELDPQYAPAEYNWSVLKSNQENYTEAKAHLDRAIALGYKPDPAYVQDLDKQLR